MRSATSRFLAALAVSGILVLGLAAPAGAAPRPFRSCAPQGGRDFGRQLVQNNAWNGSAGPQCIWADSTHHWGVSSKQSGTAVETYPDVASAYYRDSAVPYRKLTALRSRYSVSMPDPRYGNDYIAEFAYDIWVNGYSVEVMAWVDNHGQTPAGSVIASYRIYGETWKLWKGDCGQPCYSFVRKTSFSHRTVHLLSMLRILVRRHAIGTGATVTDVQFGAEICGTHNRWRNFTVHGYSLLTARR